MIPRCPTPSNLSRKNSAPPIAPVPLIPSAPAPPRHDLRNGPIWEAKPNQTNYLRPVAPDPIRPQYSVLTLPPAPPGPPPQEPWDRPRRRQSHQPPLQRATPPMPSS
jgi:hypothetical protein